eukprot:gene9586-1811_t
MANIVGWNLSCCGSCGRSTSNPGRSSGGSGGGSVENEIGLGSDSARDFSVGDGGTNIGSGSFSASERNFDDNLGALVRVCIDLIPSYGESELPIRVFLVYDEDVISLQSILLAIARIYSSFEEALQASGRHQYNFLIIPLSCHSDQSILVNNAHILHPVLSVITSSSTKGVLECINLTRHEKGLSLATHQILDVHAPEYKETPNTRPEWITHSHSCMGGSFDHLHSGHKILLTAASLCTTDTVHVGITGYNLLKNKSYAEKLETFELRSKHVYNTLRELKNELNLDVWPMLFTMLIVNVFELQDVIGPAGTAPEFECLVTSEETKGAIETINADREQHNLPPLNLVVAPLVGGDDVVRDAAYVSSSDAQCGGTTASQISIPVPKSIGLLPNIYKQPQTVITSKRFPYNLVNKLVLMRRPLLFRPVVYLPTLALTVYFYTRIETVPLTGRRRLRPIPDVLSKHFFHLMDQVLLDELEGSLLPISSKEHEFIDKIITRFKTSHKEFITEMMQGKNEQHHNKMHLLPLDDIKLRVSTSQEPNASCTGGGLIIVNVGLLELMKYDAKEIALVLGHEIGHYIAQHSAEAIGHTFLAYILNVTVSFLLGRESANPYLKAILDVFYMLPRSRNCELEADYIGLIMAARACFCVQGAEDVWKRFVLYEATLKAAAEHREPTSQDIKDILEANGNELLSTHPVFKSRLDFYREDGQWMKIAKRIQMAHCQDLFGNWRSSP